MRTGTRAAMRILPGIGAPLDRPEVALPLQNVVHGHAAGAVGIFRGERHGGIRFIPAEDYGRDADVHGGDIQIRPAGKVIEDSLPDRAFISDIAAASGERQKHQQGEGTSHALIIPTKRSFVAQRGHGVQSRGTASRQITCDQCHQRQKSGGCGKDLRITRLDLVQ
jgi:hypothetical protein